MISNVGKVKVCESGSNWQAAGIISTSDQGNDNATGEVITNMVDLNEQFVQNKAATFCLRMNSDTMADAGIFSGDTLIVDRSITNVNGKVVIAVLNGDMLVRRLEKTFNKIRLVPGTANLAAIEVDPFADFSVWGVVIYSIHRV